MINRVTRILTRWLRDHPVYGLPVLLADVAFDSSDEQAALLINGVQLPLTIYNDVDDDCTAERYDPDVVPALVIVAELSTDAPVKPGRGQLDFDGVGVSFAYLERDQPAKYARQRGGYVFTAVQDSLSAFNDPRLSRVPLSEGIDAWAEVSSLWRSLGDVEVLGVSDVSEHRVTGGVGKSRMFGAVLARFKVRRILAAPSA